MVNKRAVLINGIIASVTAVVLIEIILIGMYYHSRVLDRDLQCDGMDNYRYIGLEDDMTKQEVIDKYGEFDKVFETTKTDDGSNYYTYKVGYRISPVEAGYRYTEYPVYLVLTFNQNDELRSISQEVRTD